MKTCSVCYQDKPEGEYRKHSDGSTMSYCNDCHLAKRRAQHAASKDHRNARVRERYATNTNGMRDYYVRIRKEKYADVGRLPLIEWMNANPDRAKELQREKMKRGRDQLSDYYVRRLLTHPGRTTLKQVPQELIECKRLQLMIERVCNAN